MMTMMEEMAMVEERTMVQTGDMHSSWRKGTDSRWTRSTESRWTRSTDSRWRRSAEMLAAHGGTTASKTAAAEAAATAEATTAVAAATGEAATAVATGEAATAVAAAEAATAVAAAEATTAVAAAEAATAAVATAAAAFPCNSTGRGEGDANYRHSGKKKSDLSGHGTSPRIGIAPRKFNTTHAKSFRSRNVSLGSLLFRRSCDRHDLLRQFSRQASVYARHTGLIEEDVYTAFPELKPEVPFSVVLAASANQVNRKPGLYACPRMARQFRMPFDKHSVLRGPDRKLFDITPLSVPTPFLEHRGDDAIFWTMNNQVVLVP
jgi:hypothetical protein